MHWVLSVVDTGNGWAIRRGNKCLSVALQWENDAPSAPADPGFMSRCRYTERTALMRARRFVDRIEVAGLTFDEFADQLEKTSARGAPSAAAAVPAVPMSATA